MMEGQKLAKCLYDSAFSLKKQGNSDLQERSVWASFQERLNRELEVSGCGAKAETYTTAGFGKEAFGYHRDYGYYFVSCEGGGIYSVGILESDGELAKNRFLELIIRRRAYEWAMESGEWEETAWPYHCWCDDCKRWFGKTLEWLAFVVNWAFFAQCAERYIGLLNRRFAFSHWEYDYRLGRIIEISTSEKDLDEGC